MEFGCAEENPKLARKMALRTRKTLYIEFS
jgi:hypothetical protein